jgi:hypothetical protein
MGLYEVTAAGLSCVQGRAVALSWLHRVESSACSRFSCSVRGFACTAKHPALLKQGYTVHCAAGVRRVSFGLSE